ncbi:MAG: TIGR04086 family membrane protein, partial [Niameybacter sp.]
ERVIRKSKVTLLMKALLISYLVTAMMLLGLAFLLFRFELEESKVTWGITMIYILSCFFGGLILGKSMGNRKFLWGMLLGVAYAILLLGITVLVEHSVKKELMELLTTFLLCMGAGMIGGMLS